MKKDPPKSLVYSDDKTDLVKRAREKGMSVEEIVLNLTRGCTYFDCRAMAPDWSEELGISVSQFMIFARRRR